MKKLLALLATGSLIAGCATKPPPVIRTAAPPPVALAPPAPGDWRDAPETPGGWSYLGDAGGSVARFGRGGATDVEMRCDRATRRVSLSRPGTGGAAMTVKTSYGEQAWPAQSIGGRTTISLAAIDPALDRIAFSRGRFSIAVEGLPTLVLPAWAEPSRVIEDCRS